MRKTKPKILYLDIENSRIIVEFPTYQLWNIDRIDPKYIKHDWYITCAAWAWLDVEKQKVGKVHSLSVADYSTYKKNFRDDKGLVKDLAKIINEADLVVGHNCDKFDLRKINAKLGMYSLPEIDLPPTVDTLKANKKYRFSTSNSLAHLARELSCYSQKDELPKGTMWAADEGDLKALNRLVKYNKQDIRSGAEVYFKLLPYIKNHPDIRRIVGTINSPKEGLAVSSCSSCGSYNLERNGTRVTKQGKYRRYRCKDCGSSKKGEKI